MKPEEPLLSLTLVLFLAVLWLGFLFHQDMRFAGTFAGGMLAVSGSLFLLVPLFYSIIKRIPRLKRLVTKRISFSSLLTLHIYSGFIGAILVLLHTGHKFHGILATTLTALLLIIVFSGYTGRYLLTRISKEISEKRHLLTSLETQFSVKLTELREKPQERAALSLLSGFFSRIFASRLLAGASVDIFHISESIADIEYAISTHDLFKRLFSIWLKLHILLSLLFYVLLILHVGGEYYFGFRWFE